MKKKIKGRGISKCLYKILLIMRVTLLIILVSTNLVFSANSYAQNVKFSFHFSNATVKEVLKSIEDQSEFIVFYQDQQIDLSRKVSIETDNKNVGDILDQLFSGTENVYTVKDRQITIGKSEAQVETFNAQAERLFEQVQQPAKKSIRGKVIDSQGAPLPGASISIKGTTFGNVTDASGYYILEAKEGDILKFTFIGYKVQEITVGNKTAIDVVLQEDVTTLNETVVVGMGRQRKASVIGSISSISVQDLRVPQRSLVNALSGKMAGAVVVQRSGEPGADDASFWIRGISTFGANRSPLILVDGVERSMSDLSVEEIESVSILKDASATAVYGVRAANGVVLVTSRKGIAQKPSVELKLEYGVSDLPRLPKFLGGADYASLYNEALGRDNYSPTYIDNLRTGGDPYLYPNVNWFDQTYNKYSNNKQTTINVRGGGEVARYFVSFGYLDESGNLKNSAENSYQSNIDLKRYNFRSNVDITLNKSLVMDIEIAANLTDLHTPGLGGTLYGTDFTPAEMLFYWSYLATPISNPVKVPIGKDLNGNYIMGWGAPSQIGEMNPAERLLGSGYNSSYRNQIMSQLTINQDLTKITQGLKFKASYSFDAYNNTEIQRRKNSSTYGVQGRDVSTGEVIVKQIETGAAFLGYGSSVGSNRAKEFKVQLIYDRVFNEKHRVGSMFMYYQRDYVNGNASTSILSLPYRKQGMAYRATYGYNDRYFGEFNIGYNGSENFPKGSRFGFFPAIAGGWLISNEPFWKGIKETISLLKIKGSAGLVGAEALPNGERYGYMSVYGSGLGGYVFGESGTAYSGTGENRVGVTALTWEKGFKKNAGIEMKMFDDAVSLEADYFHERRTDILVQRQSLPAFAGMISAPFANMGEMVNRGVDGTIEFDKRYENWGFKAYSNFTFSHDKIIMMDEPQKQYAYRMKTGQKFNQQFGLIALGYFESDKDIKNSPVQKFGSVRPGDVKYEDINGDGEITVDDQVPIGYSSIPEIVYGFGIQVDYKGFDLGIFMRGQDRVTYPLGGSYIPFAQGVGKGNLFAEALDRWTVDNPRQDARYPRLNNGTSANNWQPSTKTVYDGSFLRLADIEIGD
jgi:TonB-linked SusC/RagA family outer membrane protein